ncbi:MAG: V-type ATP synthase subunit I [Enterococcus sp.]
MAVSPLKKISIIAEKTQQDTILHLLQGLQKVEIQDLYSEEDNLTWINHYFPDAIKEEGESNASLEEQMVHQIEEAITFINNYGDAKQKATKLKRQNLSLAELEKSYDAVQSRQHVSEILTLKQQWETVEQEIAKNREIESWATDWQNLDVNPEELALVSSKLVFGSVANNLWEELRKAISEQPTFYFEIINTTEKETTVGLVVMKKEMAIVQKLWQQFGVKQENHSFANSPKTMLNEAKANLNQLLKQQQELSQKIGSMKFLTAELQLAEEVILAKKVRELAKANMVTSKYLIVIRGWVAEEDVTQLSKRLDQKFVQGEIYYSYEDPTEEEIEANKLPSKLKNNKFVEPFESLTSMYSLPRYREIDPTPWLTPFYFIFFGMMVADVGYGALMLIATTVALKTMVLPKGTTNFMRLFQILSIPTIIWGLIYGSFFGAEMPFYLLLPSEDFMVIFAISMIFGGLQIFTGLFLAAKENIKRKDYLAAVNQGFSWQGILSGIIIAAAGSLVVDSQALTTIGIVIAGFSAFLVILIPLIQSDSKVGGFFMGVYDLYGVTNYIGDFVSYSRLMALGISGGSIAAAFNMLVGYMPEAARYSVGILLLLALHGLNIFLSLLGAYVHAARLQYVEFFGKFYLGGGREFKTFKPTEKYMNLTDENGGKNK